MPKFNINKCLIPTIYCGKGSYKSASPSNNYSKYTKKGSPSECIKKGIGAGIYIEKKKNLTKTSLQNIPYIGPVYEKKFKSHKITTLAKLESYIEDYVGITEEGYGDMYFNRTLNDWARFNINDRTKFDASISSGLCIMANQKHLYMPEKKESKLIINFAKYKNEGTTSQLIR
jgi:hypothetical protein